MKVCMRCNKSVQVANSRSHSNIASKRRQYPNLQKATIGGKKMLLCTSCLKAATRQLAK